METLDIIDVVGIIVNVVLLPFYPSGAARAFGVFAILMFCLSLAL